MWPLYLHCSYLLQRSNWLAKRRPPCLQRQPSTNTPALRGVTISMSPSRKLISLNCCEDILGSVMKSSENDPRAQPIFNTIFLYGYFY